MASAAPLPLDEPARLARLLALDVLDTAPEAIFDALTAAAAEVCGVPIALVSLIDAGRQWFKSRVGLAGARETPRELAFCAHAILGQDVMQVGDALLDPRFADNPLVTGQPGIRFYAGAPILLSGGAALGTLCVIDRIPRQLTEGQLCTMRHLATAAARAFEFRERAAQALAAADQAQAHLEQLYRATPAMLHAVDADGRIADVSERWLAELGYRRADVVGRPIVEFMTPESRRWVEATVVPAFLETGRIDQVEWQMRHKDGHAIDVRVSALLERDADGHPLRSNTALENVTDRKHIECVLAEERGRMASILEGTRAGTWEWNVQTGATVYNERWAEIIGHTLAELAPTSNRTFIDRVHPADIAPVREMIRRHLDGELSFGDFEGRLRHRDGSWVWVRVRGRISSRDAAGRVLLMHGTLSDIGDRKRAEDALRASQSFLQRVSRVAGVGGWELDIATRTITWSDETCRLHDREAGYQPALHEAIQYSAPEARPAVTLAVHEGISLGKPWDLELPFVSAKGRPFWARSVGSVEFEDGKPVRLVGAFQDVTARKQIERQLGESRELLQVTLESIGDAVITTDTDGCVQWLNPVAERLTGWVKAEARGLPLTQVFVIINEETRKPTPDPVSICLAEERIVAISGRTALVSRDGKEYGIEDSASPIRGPTGVVHGAVLVFHDVSEQRRLNHEMSHRATHDLLTGLVNRSEFETRLARVLERVKADRSANALLYIDLDQFKLVNDACGHAIGDQLLRQVSVLLAGCVRARDTLARLGGDEFGVILEFCNTQHAEAIAQKICDQMEEFRFLHDGRRFRVGTSIGLVPVDRRWSNMTAILQAADASCYAAKEAGRNRVHVWFDTDQAIKTRHGELQWVSRLERALDENAFALYGQRIEALDGSTRGLHCEVLLRLCEPDGGIVLPGAFLPAAERFHMATRIDRWVVRNVFAWMTEQQEASGDDGATIELIAVNLSGQSIGDRAFHRDICELIRRAPFDVGKLCFEITETAAVTNFGDAKVFIDEVRALGVRIALDDFGAGASSFGYLKTLPVDFLKIDGQFITRLLEDPLDDAAVRCFRDVARVIGVKTIAEFVEREDVRNALRTIGVDMAQGFLIHRPQPLSRLAAPLTA